MTQIQHSVISKTAILCLLVGFIGWFPQHISAQCSGISGRVFQDFNYNGIDDEGGFGADSIRVYAFGEYGYVDSTWTSLTGAYSFATAPNGQRFRVEFRIPTSRSYFKPTWFGSSSATGTQFVASPNCSVNFGVSAPSSYCQDNPPLIVPCYINGDPLKNGTAKDSVVLVSAPYNTPHAGSKTNLTALLTAKDVGSLWGVTYHRKRRSVISTATLRRHVGFGPKGTGAVYFVDYANPTTPSVLGSLNLWAGTDPRIAEPLPADVDKPSYDISAFSQIGKFSLGGVAISEDEKSLYVMNLFTKKLCRIDLSNYTAAGTLPSVADIKDSISMPSPCGATGVFRPWAVSCHNGKVYIGGVCDASNGGTRADLAAYIYELNGNSWKQVLTFSLDYKRGPIFRNNYPNIREWNPWTDNYQDLRAAPGDYSFVHPQPVLSDIEFDSDGSMVLGFLDRTSMQTGYSNYAPSVTEGQSPFFGFSGGDILRVCHTAAGYSLENASTSCSNTGGATDKQGPGGGEYYWSDYWPYPTNQSYPPAIADTTGIHNEITSGGLALVPGKGQVVATVYDPLSEAQSGGFVWFNNTTGGRDKSFEIFSQNGTAANIGFFGKASGLADIHAACNAAPLMIGNRVWSDCNGNGIQDPNELGIEGVKVTLYSAACQPLSTKTTDAKGEYYFDNLTPETTYYIVYGESQTSNGYLKLSGKTYALTAADKGQGVNADENDSDAKLLGSPACIAGLPATKVVTGVAGCSDFSYDAGFVELTFVVNSIEKNNEMCAGTKDGKIIIHGVAFAGTFQYSINGGTTWQVDSVFSKLAPGHYPIAVQVFGVSSACNAKYLDSVDILAGPLVNPPTTQADSVCRYDIGPRHGGLSATAQACQIGVAPVLSWYAAQFSATPIFKGNIFNPIANGSVNPSVVGTVTFWVQTDCGNCSSVRVPVNFVVLPRPEPKVTGKLIPCNNEVSTYSCSGVASNSYVWSLPNGGGLIQGSNTGNSCVVKWTAGQGTGPFKVRVTETNPTGCVQTNEVVVFLKGTVLACIGSLNVTIDNNCTATLTANTFLAGNQIGAELNKIQLLRNQLVLEEGIGTMTLDGIALDGSLYSLLSGGYTYRVIDPCTNNACWGNVNFEDKTAPILTCPQNITLSCSQLGDAAIPLPSVSGQPTAIDCSPTTMSYNDQLRETDCTRPFTSLPSDLAAIYPSSFPTTGDITRIILRRFTVKDKFGYASSCYQYIFVRRASLNYVVCPKDYEIECKNSTIPITPIISGYPFVDIDGDYTTTYDQISLDHLVCKFNVSYKDDTLRICAGSIKIFRKWTILDFCAVDNPATPQDESRKECTQVIQIIDKTPPSVSAGFTQYYTQNGSLAPKDTIVNFDSYSIRGGADVIGTTQQVYALANFNNCGGKARFIMRANDQNCSQSIVTFSSNVSNVQLVGSPQFNALTGETTVVYEGSFDQIGDYSVTFTATDACGNASAKKTFLIHVLDNAKPQAVCTTTTTTTLVGDGTARVTAASFDNNSWDNCGVDHIAVRRMTNCQNSTDTLFNSYVDFSCCDVGKEVMVMLRVYDFAGNYSDCMSQIKIDNKSKPTCTAPASKVISCNDPNLLNHAQFGQPSLWDNCGIKDTVYTYNYNLNNCKIGTLTRKWVITNAGGRKDSCSQLVEIHGISDFTVDFPDDIVANCFASVPTKEQLRLSMLTNTPNKDGHIVNNGCGVMLIEITDDTLSTVSSACYKILRRISVIDGCKYSIGNSVSRNNAIGSPVCGDVHSNTQWANQNESVLNNVLRPSCSVPQERRFRDADNLAGPLGYDPSVYSDGIISFTQVISIIDNTPPVFSPCPKDTIIKNTASFGCVGDAKLVAYAVDQCLDSVLNNESFLHYSWTISDALTNQSLKSGDGNTIFEPLDYGRNYLVNWKAEDRCGNAAFCTQKVKVVDAKAPSITCSSVNAQLVKMIDGTSNVTVLASDWLAGQLTDNCTSTSFLNNALAIERASGSTLQYPSVPQKSLSFNCADAGLAIPVRVWTKDEAGNANFCISKINVQDNFNLCPASTNASLSGFVQNETNLPVEGVNLSVFQNSNAAIGTSVSNLSGAYSISNLTRGSNLLVRANRDDNQINGVTSFDVAILTRHILGISPITSPYKIIAADVNRDGDVSSLDALSLRRVILRISSSFLNNTPSWRFIDKQYQFLNPANPLAEDFPEMVSLSNIPTAAQANFVAIKVGDLNNSAYLTATQSTTQLRDAREALILQTDNVVLQSGKEYAVTLRSDHFNVAAFQFTLNHTEGVEILKITNGTLPDVSDNNFGRFKTAITTSWNGNYDGSSADVFTVYLKAKHDGLLSDLLSIGSNLTSAEAYDTNGNILDVKLQFKGLNTERSNFMLYQNEPNPFTSETKISFNLPTESMAKLTIYDVAGRTLQVIEGNYKTGYNEVTLKKAELNGADGILFYRLDTPTHNAVKKMIMKN